MRNISLYPSLVFLFFILSCSDSVNSDKPSVIVKDSISNLPAQETEKNQHDKDSVNLSSSEVDSEEFPYQLFYIISVAESYSYDSLEFLGKDLSKKMNVKFETMDRVYDPKKGIVVKMDSEDEIYRGEYYPRRYPDDCISIEMKYAFSDSIEKTDREDLKMVLIGGVFSERKEADSIYNLVKSYIPNARFFSRELYIGCMH